MFNVIKRDGEVAAFQLSKITQAIEKAFQAQEKQYTPDMMEMLGLRVTADFQKKIKKDQVSVEDIQDSVENVLIQCGYSEVAKAYILYRKQREKVRNMKSTILDYKEIVNSYVKVEDWRVKENSTVTYSVGGLILSNSGAVTANYWLSEIYDKEIADAHRNADIHIHDLSMLTGYCAGWSLKQLIKEGLGGIEGKMEYVGIGYWKPLPLASPSIMVSINALLTISISCLQSLYLKSISFPPTIAGSSARSSGTVQSSVILENGACVPQRLGVFTP